MKIEKVNDHQIRCTLTTEDLASRRLQISELAYGSEKAKLLFRDMMEKANDEYGFNAVDIPLMIEAIPIKNGSIVLVITKVEDPEELDTRFSKFAPGIGDDSESDSDDDSDFSDLADDIEDITNLFKKFTEAVDESSDSKKKQSSDFSAFDGMAFTYSSITELASVCVRAKEIFSGSSCLYKNKTKSEYLLTITRGKTDITDFVQVCNLFSEFGAPRKGKSITMPYLKEHFEEILPTEAIEKLAEIG